MTNWKVTLEHNGAIYEFTLKAKTYADAFVGAQSKYPAGRITSIKSITSLVAKNKK